MPEITIDGKRIDAPANASVLDVALANDIWIPTLCHHPNLSDFGACRLCLVEVSRRGRSRVTASCTLPVQAGLEVITNSERVARLRRLVMELILASCPHSEAVVSMAGRLCARADRLEPDPDNDCIRCGLCVRACEELSGAQAINFAKRGVKRTITTPFGVPNRDCVMCGACVFVCPTGSRLLDLAKIAGETPQKLLSRFEANLAARGAIHRPFPQALPNVPVIDRTACLRLNRDTCGICEKVCAAKAIRFEDEDHDERVDVGAVILAPGTDVFRPEAFEPLGHGRFPNVLTSLEFERTLSASGPFAGHLVRPSDHEEPRRIAWLQCVGSRNVNQCDNAYCSAVCCMYAIKQAVIAKEHSRNGLETTIFFMDMRTYGKDFERFYERAEHEQGVRFVRSRIHTVLEDPETRGLVLRYAAEDASVHEERFDMVVLSVGLQTSEEAKQLGRTVGLELDRYGFCTTPYFDSVATSRPGVFTCGVFGGPKDIPESVMQASAAAAQAAALLSQARHTQTRAPELPPERDVRGEPPRIGVFVCHCGINIGGVVDVPAVVAYARTLPNVVLAEENLYTCSQDAQEHIKQMIRDRGLNRVVVASCSPRTHEPIFQQTCREAGLNPDLFEMANIRDQASWVHAGDSGAATAKAGDLVRMAVAKARLLRPLTRQTFDVTKAALVVGGGVAGMSAALNVAEQGFDVHLVEKSESLGGQARRLRWILEGGDVRELVASLTDRVESHPGIRVYRRSEIRDVSGFVGNFAATVETPDGTIEIEHGAAIIATGAGEHRPTEYAYGNHPRVLTVTELEERVAARSPELLGAETVAFIQCVGSRESQRPYCSRVCCSHSVKLALRLKELKPRMRVFVLYRDLRTYGLKEDYYQDAREKGVIFIRYEAEGKPKVEPVEAEAGRVVRVSVIDHVLGRPIEIDADFLALAVATESADNTRLSQLYKVPLNADGFFLEAHMKLRPVDFATDGVFLCGLAHGPKTVAESITQARAAAGRAVTVLAKDRIEAPGSVAEVIEGLCAGCGLCEALCAFKAISVDPQKKVAVVNEAMCKGCGVCASSCRSGAATIRGFTDAQLAAMISSVGVVQE